MEPAGYIARITYCYGVVLGQGEKEKEGEIGKNERL